jgi:hypothetical protein
MKKAILLPLLLIVSLGLVGCSKGMDIKIGAFENNTSTKMSCSYSKFDGVDEDKITVEEGETVIVSVAIETKDGSIDAYIINEKDEYEYEGHDVPTSSFTVTLSEAGTYTMKVDANNHKGSYSFTWE